MAALKAGDAVVIVKREVTTEDEKSGLYFSYFGDLYGVIDRIYEDESLCVDVDLDSLDPSMKKRHLEMQEAERKRWLDGLSDEARNRLNAEQKKLKISYKILVSKKDILPNPGGAKEKLSKENKTEAKADKGAADAASLPITPSETPAKRLTEKDLEKAEEEFLKQVMEKKL